MIHYLPNSFEDFLICTTVFVLGALVCALVSKQAKLPFQFGLALYGWHTLFCIAYVYFLLSSDKGGDALAYYLDSFDRFLGWQLGTLAVKRITSVFTMGMGLSFLAVNLVFNIVGTLGLIFFAAALKIARGKIDYFVLLLVFMPSISYWSCALGKDSVAVFSVGLLSWSFMDKSPRIWHLALALGAMVVVRPHVAIVMLPAIVLSLMVRARNSPLRAAFAGVASIAAILALAPLVISVTNIGSLSFAGWEEVVDSRLGGNLVGGSAVDISNMPFYAKIPSYLFRPLPYEASGLAQVLSSIDNTILLAVFLWSLFWIIRSRAATLQLSILPLLIFSLILLVNFAFMNTNLGIAVRQKWMLLIPLLVWFSAAIHYKDRIGSARQSVRRPYFPGEDLQGTGYRGGYPNALR